MKLTFADHLALDKPLADDGEEECQSIDDGDGQAQLYNPRTHVSKLPDVTILAMWQRVLQEGGGGGNNIPA